MGLESARIDRLRESLDKRELDALIVVSPVNVRYLSGFTGTGAVALISNDKKFLITDSLHAEQAELEVKNFEMIVCESNQIKSAADLVSDFGKAGIEDTASIGLMRELTSHTSGRVHLVPVEGIIEEMRSVKDDGEIELIRSAVNVAAHAFGKSFSMLKSGCSERAFASELIRRTIMSGAEGTAFDIVVASGERSSLPHATFTDREFMTGDVVVVDFGAVVNGYCSDVTRTLLVGNTSKKVEEAYEAVGRALDAAIENTRHGVEAGTLYEVARGVLEEHGFADRFIHSLGHGVGLEVHERPSLSKGSKSVLEEGMVLTLEPGVYFKGEFGVRIEEMVVVTKGGCEVLTGKIERNPSV